MKNLPLKPELWYRIPDVARLLGVDRAVVARAIESGALPGYRLGERAIRVRGADVVAWINAARL